MGTAKIVTVRVPADLVARLKRATTAKGKEYAPTATAIILRGLSLALKEIEAK